jgi:hypothetical protein
VEISNTDAKRFDIADQKMIRIAFGRGKNTE